MKSGIKKAASGKTMRVATLFTGAAACAAAFAPAAHAATAKPDTEPASCATTPRWVHVANSISEVCFGFKGTSHFPGLVYITAECGGNNSGRLFGPQGTWNFGPGHTYTRPKYSIFSGITITKSNAGPHSLCPTTP
jgi:hypothetical protein